MSKTKKGTDQRSAWALRDPETAAHWARSFTDDTLRQRASAEVAALANSDTSREAPSR